jgi:ComF family protein
MDLENPLFRRFWGKVPITYGFSYLKLSKGGAVENMLYKIKYHGMKEAATKLGVLYGKDLVKDGFESKFDLMVSVPMHISKQKKRGYNQSDYFASGLATSMNVDYDPNVMQRVAKNSSQTLKSRFNRWLNVKDIYQVNEVGMIKNQHVLLVDDVVTTGATFEACARELLLKGAREVSVAAISIAQ